MNAKKELLDLVLLIHDPEIQKFTIDMLEVLPGVFWTAKASRNHHPLDERGSEGNLIHTVRVVKLCRILAECRRADQIEVDILTSAAALHDGGRYDLDGKAPYTVENHPHLIRELANTKGLTCPHAEEVFTHIERHMGMWGDPTYSMAVTFSTILSLADSISSRAHEVWGEEKMQESTWHGDTPFKDRGMDADKMELLKELIEDNAYWQAANRFMEQVSTRKFSSLTVKQQDWLDDIVAQLADELNKKTGKEVWKD